MTANAAPFKGFMRPGSLARIGSLVVFSILDLAQQRRPHGPPLPRRPGSSHTHQHAAMANRAHIGPGTLHMTIHYECNDAGIGHSSKIEPPLLSYDTTAAW
jgi:hypothetical protein